MAGKQDPQPEPGRNRPPGPFLGEPRGGRWGEPHGGPSAGPRFDSRTGRPLWVEGGNPPTMTGARPARPLRRRTFVRDLVLLVLHLAVYVVVIGGILYQLQFIGYGALSVRYASFDAIFWPAYAWGTLIAAQAGATVFQRRRFLGAIIGAMTSVLLGTWVLGQFIEYEVTAIVFRSIAVALIALALGVSLIHRPPAFMLAEIAVPAPRSVSGPVIARTRRSGFASFPGVLLGMFALVFVLAGIAAGSYRALEVRGSGEAGQRVVAVPAFDRISASGTGQLDVRLGDQPEVSIAGDANLLDFAKVDVTDGELSIDFDPGARGDYQLERPLVYTVTTPSLTALSLGGDVSASLDESLKDIASLRVVAEDQATFTSPVLTADTFSGAFRDEATLTLFGRVESLDIEADDNAFVDLEALSTADATVSARAAARVLLGEAIALAYEQSGVALIQCHAGTEILSGSRAEVPQCGGTTMTLPDSDPDVGQPSDGVGAVRSSR